MQRPERVMVWVAENIQACLRDFLSGAASMARKRHLASTARGFWCFCLMAQIEVQKVQWVQIRPIRPIRQIRQIRLIRDRIESRGQGFCGFCLMTSHAQDINPPHPWQNNYPLNVFLISVLSCFFILHYTAKMGIYQKINANRRYFPFIDFCIARCQVRSKPF